MSGQMWNLENFSADGSWTLFLDRDGVINTLRVDDYVKNWSEFEFVEGVLDSMAVFNQLFGTIVVVTNQQGIGRQLMTEQDLHDIHQHMVGAIESVGGRIDKIYFCPHLAKDNPRCRKPETGMAVQAQNDFPNIQFSRSIMVGDSEKDMEFARRLNMPHVRVTGGPTNFEGKLTHPEITKLSDLASYLTNLTPNQH